MDTSNQFCFCTLAVGKRYRTHAEVLARDLEMYIPSTKFCILTDRPEQFQPYPQVLAFEHRLQSVKGYHDKRFVLKKALSLFESCLFLDSDVRVLGPTTKAVNWSPGITARAGTKLLAHMNNIKNPKEIEVIRKAADKLGVDLQNVQWLHEFMFVMKRQDGLEEKFFDLWQTISYFFELEGLYSGECYSIGLAAALVGLKFDYIREDFLPFFKDNIERERVKHGQSQLENRNVYFEAHKKIESPQRTLPTKVVDKLKSKALLYSRILRLKRLAKQDPYFAQMFG